MASTLSEELRTIHRTLTDGPYQLTVYGRAADELERLEGVIENARRVNDSQSNSADQWEDMNRALKGETR